MYALGTLRIDPRTYSFSHLASIPQTLLFYHSLLNNGVNEETCSAKQSPCVRATLIYNALRLLLLLLRLMRLPTSG